MFLILQERLWFLDPHLAYYELIYISEIVFFFRTKNKEHTILQNFAIFMTSRLCFVVKKTNYQGFTQ